MKVLLVAATASEIPWLPVPSVPASGEALIWLRGLAETVCEGCLVDVLLTGIGMVNTALALGAYAAARPLPHHLLNVGICGSFGAPHSPGTLVEVREEVYADLGAEDGSRWLDLKQLKFPAFLTDTGPVYNRLENPYPSATQYPGVRGVTSNRVTGSDTSRQWIAERWNPAIETMEGAAVFQAGIQLGIPFTCLRAVSNWVAPRSEHPWSPAPAIAALELGVREFLRNQVC